MAEVPVPPVMLRLGPTSPLGSSYLVLMEIFVVLLSLSQNNAGKSAETALWRGVHTPDLEEGHPGVTVPPSWC